MVKDLLTTKNSQEKSQIKSLEIAKLKHSGIYDSVQYGTRIEIIGEVKAIEVNGQHGIELFARAWKGTQPLGFGADGSVDIERFRIFNPPILVDDPNGTIIREWTDEITGELKQRKLREDPLEATRQVIAHNAKLVGKENAPIVLGKVGNTTDTFYPQAGSGGGNTTNDGRWVIANNATWAGAHDATAATSGSNTEPQQSVVATLTGGTYYLYRLLFSFDTSAISTDNISSATFSLYVTSGSTADAASVVLVGATPASNSNFVADDYDQLGTTSFGSYTISGQSINIYNDISLNASGISTIIKTGITPFGVRLNNDLSNTAPTGGNNSEIYLADQADTVTDPKLVVVHSVVPLTLSLSASVAMTESRTSRVGVNKTAAFLFTELTSKNVGKSTTDAMSMLESTSSLSTFQRNPSESFSFLESKTTLSTFQRIFSDNLIFAENLSKQSGKTLLDSFLIIKSIAKISEYQKALSESLTLSEASVKTVIFQRMLSETILIIESLQKHTDLSFSSALSLIESMLTTSEYSRSLTENLNLAESLLKLAEFKLNFSLIISIAEDLSKNTDMTFSIALQILESFSKTSEFNLQNIDILSLAELISKQTGKPLTDIVSILDSIPLVERGLVTSATDSVSIAEQFRKDIGMNFSSTLTISENKTTLVDFIRTFSDSVQITETLAKQMGLTLQELAVLAENIIKITELHKSETIILLESKVQSVGLQKTDTLLFSESFRKEAMKQNMDSFQLSETSSHSSILVVTDSFNFQDILKYDTVKKIAELLAISESITKAINIPKNEILLITENAAKSTSRPISDMVSMSESFLISQGYGVNIVDSVTLLEVLIKDFGLSISDASALTAVISLKYMSAFATQRITVLTTVQGRTVLLARS